SMTKITDIPHFEQCRILDYVKWNCDHRNGNESIAAIKYLDILNFAMASHIFDRIVWNWSRPMYELLEIEKRLFPDKKITVKFNRIHDALKKASSAQKESYIDINISTMMNKMSLDCIELEYEPQEFVVDHDDIFQDVLKAIQGEKSRKEFIILDPIINDLGNFRNISKLRLTASFDMADLEEFCINNPGLVDLEINSYHFTDHGRLTQIVPNCPKLKNLKFILNDNAWDMDYVRLANLSSLQRLEIEKPPSSVVEYDWQSSPEFAAKRARMDYEVRNLIPVLELLKALSQKKKSTLVKLILKFDIDDETVCEIVKIKGLRMLECGLCYLSSIGHLKQISSLQQVTLLNRGHLVSDDVVELLKKRVTISGVDTRMTLTAGGHLGIDSTDAELYRSVNVDIFLKIENLKSLWLSNDLIISMDLALVKFLELGIEV
ncbi:hypothetical protein KR009_011940, partial [Drosophila setifemur]